MSLTTSLRARFLFIVLTLVVVPLALMGVWLTSMTSRSGEELLRSRLGDALNTTVAEIGARWVRWRSELLVLAEDTAAHRALQSGDSATVMPASLVARFNEMDVALRRVVIRDEVDEIRWHLARPERPETVGTPSVKVRLGMHDRRTGQRVGTLEALLSPRAILGATGGSPGLLGAVLGVIDLETGTPLLPIPFDSGLLEADRFQWSGEEWLTARRILTDPAMALVAAGPLDPFTQPFQRAQRTGLTALLVVSLGGLGLAWALTGGLTSSLARMAAAADAVARGDLEQTLEEPRDEELRRVARAFNTMSENLRQTLKELAGRKALSAVGEFAASLAHEVRNPLTAVRLDLQRVEEGLPEDSPLVALQRRALDEIARLDKTVGSALEVARTAAIAATPVDVLLPMRAAIAAAGPAVDASAATIVPPASDQAPILIRGDAGALEQLFLNLLLNAAQALEPGGLISVELRTDGETVLVSIRDTGVGIAEDLLPQVFEPLFSTRSDGTGLGLTIAGRIAESHGGEIRIESRAGEGTTVTVQLPLEPSPHQDIL